MLEKLLNVETVWENKICLKEEKIRKHYHLLDITDKTGNQ